MNIENLCINCMKEKAHSEGPCEHCGYNPAEDSIPPHHLSPFVILEGKYLVGKAIGEGGFGITYIGMDLNLEMRVAIKEYYPNGCAVRNTRNSTVQSYEGEQKVFFENGREKFINEAKAMARFVNLPEIVTVKDFFRENQTAYIVMEYVDGMTLKTYLRENGGRLPVGKTLDMMRPVIRSLSEVHKENLIHRDISPDNLMLTKDGKMKVLDFGGARDFASANGRSLSIMLKPGYAPEEQYRSHGEQGPWTDVYALCATIYRCITGEIPPEAMERTYRDTLKPLSAYQISVSDQVQYALKKGLSVYRKDRFQNMEELYNALYRAGFVPPPEESVQRIVPPEDDDRTVVVKEELPVVEKESGGSALKILIYAAFCILLVVLIFFFTQSSSTGNQLISSFTEVFHSREEETEPAPVPEEIREETPTPTPPANVLPDDGIPVEG